MPGIYGMAVLTIIITAILCITFLNQLTKSDRRYTWLILAGLPLSLIINRFVKTPAITSLATWAGIPLQLSDAPFWFVAAVWLNAPIFEEGIKLIPVIVPASRAFLRDAAHALWAGLAVGMGFGLGEAAYLAYGIAQISDYQGLPWHVFTGFATERLIVTFAHGFMTSFAVLGLHDGRKRALFRYLAAVGLHALINLGPILLALKMIPAAVSSLITSGTILGTFIIFQREERAARKVSKILTEEIIYFER